MSSSPARPKAWWHNATVYQIYPRSFCDSNGDGIGDLAGIVSKLYYLQALGVGVIWLSPIYASPMDDNGYDIADYRAIAPEYGTLADFDALVSAARARGIGVLLDLVVNHTSDEHAWFGEAVRDPKSGRRDFYIFRDPGPDGGPPNQLRSVFGGPAWSLEPNGGQYYLHQFSRRQPDLNWANPALRAEIYAMMNFWLDRGIAGFRLDVVDLLGKDPDAMVMADGPHLHHYLQEMNRATFGARDVLTVGEAWSATPGAALLYSGAERGELSMVFQFEHVTQQWDEVHGKWRPKPFDLVALKSVLNRWQYGLADDGWNALFWGNHDLPRSLNRYGDVTGHRVDSAKMLATALHLMHGTPFIYQGEEIGMTNPPFTAIEQYRDVETRNLFALHVEAGLAPDDFLAMAQVAGRDMARTPMQWSAQDHGGFTTGVPWIEANPNYAQVNAAHNMADDGSIWAHYRTLIALRKRHPVIVYGRYHSYCDTDPQLLVYTRTLEATRLIVVANFSARPAILRVPGDLQGAGQGLIANAGPVDALGETHELAPYEAFALLREG